MNKSHCELVQIANYGMGGHYVPHYDYLIKDKPQEQRWNVSEKELFAGDRMATFMIYVSSLRTRFHGTNRLLVDSSPTWSVEDQPSSPDWECTSNQ